MYCEYYGFKEKPFNITPNPRFIFLSKNHKEAFAHILYGIDSHAGFLELTGEVGTGKTTVLRTLLGRLDDDTHRIALIFNPCLSAIELLRLINSEYGIPSEGLSKAELLDALNRFLLKENREGRTVVLVIDEAQNLEPEVLEQIRLISNLETEQDKLIQIILAGQPELAILLARPELRQLSQRITVRYHLLPMDFDDTKGYIEHRLEVAGGWRAAVFTPAALKRIYRFSGGTPRLINIVSDRALLVGYGEESREISGHMAAAAVKETKSRAAAFSLGGWLKPAVAALFMAAILAALYPLARHSRPVAAPAHIEPPPARPVSPDLRLLLQRELAAVKGAESPARGFNAIARLWRVKPLASSGRISPRELERLAASRDLRLARYNGSIASLLRMNVPALLEITLPRGSGKRYLALTGAENNRLLLYPSAPGRRSLSREELEAVWSGKGYIFWRNFQEIPAGLAAGSRGTEVIRLQMLLLGSGSYRGEPSGLLDKATTDALKAFQSSHGLEPDGKVGAQTLMLLYRDGGGFKIPMLAPKAEGKPA